MLLLLPLLLLPFLLCCLLCCPCCAPILGGKKAEKYAVLGAAPAAAGYQQGTFIDDWYEQSKIYNNPAYMEDNWDSGSAHLLVMGNETGKHAANGTAVNVGHGEEVIEETEEYFRQNGGNDMLMRNEGMGNGHLANGHTTSYDMTDEARVTTSHFNTMKSSKAESAVIVDTLTPSAPSAAETMVIEEETTERRLAEENQANRRENTQPLTTSVETEHHHQMSSLSPATLDILDSASTYNAKMAARNGTTTHTGFFSHTATVPRYGNHPPLESDEYITSEAYESDYHSDQRRQPPPPRSHSRTRYQEDTGMTIILDAQPTPGMEVENVEYEVVTDIPNGGTSHHSRSGYVETHSAYKGSRAGTIPRGGFTIELEPTTVGHSGMVADREEYVLTDDDGLSPEFFSEAPRSPTQRRRYEKTTRTVRGNHN